MYMIDHNKKPILVTGSHRSGSTWTGRIIALSPNVAYIHEPFNLYHRPGIIKVKLNYWFPYICDENDYFCFNAFKDCINFKYYWLDELRIAKSIKDIGRLLRDYFLTKKYAILNKRPLVKDPIAVFSAEWLAKRFNMDVVVLIRHPAAFVGSLKKAKWKYPFIHFLKQPLLMQHYLSKYRPILEEYSKKEKDIIEQAILLWNIIHYMILKYRDSNPNWIFVRHEDLSIDPIENFRKLYMRLGLKFSPDIEKKISDYSFAGPQELNSNNLKRDSRKNIWSWKRRLTTEEIKKVKENTYAIASQFYSEKDWAE